jgi:hypothetical protein
MAAWSRRWHPPIVALGLGYALVLMAIELVYVFNGTISAIYLLDTGVEIVFVIGWLGHKPKT